MITSSAEASVAIKVVNGGEITDSFSLHSFQNEKKKEKGNKISGKKKGNRTDHIKGYDFLSDVAFALR